MNCNKYNKTENHDCNHDAHYLVASKLLPLITHINEHNIQRELRGLLSCAPSKQPNDLVFQHPSDSTTTHTNTLIDITLCKKSVLTPEELHEPAFDITDIATTAIHQMIASENNKFKIRGCTHENSFVSGIE